MSRLGRGDSQALGEIYVRYASVVRTALTRSAPELPRAQREELTQDVFLALLESARRYREEERLKAFLYGISVKKARMWRRQTWLRRHLLQRHSGSPIAMAGAHEDSPAKLTETREDITQALDQLPESQREVLLLHAEGFSGDEIAELLKIRPKTVWTRLHRARSLLLAAAALSAAVLALFVAADGAKQGPRHAAPSPESRRAPVETPVAPSLDRANAVATPDAAPRQIAGSEQAVDLGVVPKSAIAERDAGVRQTQLNVRTAASQAKATLREASKERELAASRKKELEALRGLVIEGRLGEAEPRLRQLSQHSDRDSNAGSLLADCLRKQGRYREAVETYRRVIALGPSPDADRARFLAAALLQDRLQDPQGAIALLEAFDKSQVVSPEAQLRLARALVAVGQVARARAILEALLRQHPASTIAAEARRLLSGTVSDEP